MECISKIVKMSKSCFSIIILNAIIFIIFINFKCTPYFGTEVVTNLLSPKMNKSNFFVLWLWCQHLHRAKLEKLKNWHIVSRIRSTYTSFFFAQVFGDVFFQPQCFVQKWMTHRERRLSEACVPLVDFVVSLNAYLGGETLACHFAVHFCVYEMYLLITEWTDPRIK